MFDLEYFRDNGYRVAIFKGIAPPTLIDNADSYNGTAPSKRLSRSRTIKLLINR